MRKVQLTSILSFSFILVAILEGVSTVNASPLKRNRGSSGRGFGRNNNNNNNNDDNGNSNSSNNGGPPTLRVSLNDDDEIVTVPDVTVDVKRITVASTKEVSNAKVLDDVNWACFFVKDRDWTISSPPSPSSSTIQSGTDDYTVISRTFAYDADPDARETFDPPFQYKFLTCFRLPSPSTVNEEVILFTEASVSDVGTGADIQRFPLPPYGIKENRVHITMNDLSNFFNRPPTLRRSAIVYAPPRSERVTCYALDRLPDPPTTYKSGVPFSQGNPFVGGLENWLSTACEVNDTV